MSTFLRLAPDFRLIVEPAPPLPPETLARVETIWSELKAQRGETLFNAPVFVLGAHSPACVTIREMQYRHLAARKVDAALAAHGLGVTFLGVTGLVLCQDGLVLGRRSPQAFFYPGQWEPAPAGTLDFPDPAAKVIEEMGEELGIGPEAVTKLTALALSFDRPCGLDSADILFRIDIALDAKGVIAAHRARGTDEYSEIAIVAPGDIARFLADNRTDLTPTLPGLLAWAGLA